MPDMPSLPPDLLANAPVSGTKNKKSSKKKQAFDDMPMTTITEFDYEDDNEMGLLAGGSNQDDDDMSYRSNRSSRSRGGRFKMGLKKPKLKGIGKFMPKRKDSKPSNSGFFDEDSGGLLG